MFILLAIIDSMLGMASICRWNWADTALNNFNKRSATAPNYHTISDYMHKVYALYDKYEMFNVLWATTAMGIITLTIIMSRHPGMQKGLLPLLDAAMLLISLASSGIVLYIGHSKLPSLLFDKSKEQWNDNFLEYATQFVYANSMPKVYSILTVRQILAAKP